MLTQLKQKLKELGEMEEHLCAAEAETPQTSKSGDEASVREKCGVFEFRVFMRKKSFVS